MEHLNGAIEDPRSQKEKNRDYTHLDVGLGIPTWEEKPWRTLSLRRQITSYSCGGQAGAKCVESFTENVESATPTYRFRSNFPNPGMYIQEIGDNLKKKHTTTETLCPSQNMTEEQMNSAVIPSNLFDGISGYYAISVDIDAMAAALEQGHAIILLIKGHIDEWTEVPIYNGKESNFSHFVASVPKNYTLYKGEKSIVIDDSCNASTTIKGTGQRILTESYINSRCKAVLGLIRASETDKPHCNFTKDLSFGMTDSEVQNLQECLKYEGFFPNISTTTFFGKITKNSLIKWQEKHAAEVLIPNGLTHGTGFCGPNSRDTLNRIYGSKV